MHQLITDHSSNSQWLNSLDPQNKSKKQYSEKNGVFQAGSPNRWSCLAATTVTCLLKHLAGISCWRKQYVLITEKSSWNFYLFLWALGSILTSLGSNSGVTPLLYFFISHTTCGQTLLSQQHSPHSSLNPKAHGAVSVQMAQACESRMVSEVTAAKDGFNNLRAQTWLF